MLMRGGRLAAGQRGGALAKDFGQTEDSRSTPGQAGLPVWDFLAWHLGSTEGGLRTGGLQL